MTLRTAAKEARHTHNVMDVHILYSAGLYHLENFFVTHPK